MDIFSIIEPLFDFVSNLNKIECNPLYLGHSVGDNLHIVFLIKLKPTARVDKAVVSASVGKIPLS
jgi:hypothetical protein